MNRNVTYQSFDGTKLNGTLSSNKNSNCIILCHGLKADQNEYGTFAKLSEIFLNNGYDNFRFDFRGHGKSDGDTSQITVHDLIKDLEATITLVQNSSYKKIHLLGASFGASILSLINYEKFQKIKSLIIWSGSIDFDNGNPKGSLGSKNYIKAMRDGFVDIKSKTTGKIIRLNMQFMFETRSLNPTKAIQDVNLPILFIHGTEDKTTPYNNAKKLASSCKMPYFKTVCGASHGLHNDNEITKATEYIQSFLSIEFPDIPNTTQNSIKSDQEERY